MAKHCVQSVLLRFRFKNLLTLSLKFEDGQGDVELDDKRTNLFKGRENKIN